MLQRACWREAMVLIVSQKAYPALRPRRQERQERQAERVGKLSGKRSQTRRKTPEKGNRSLLHVPPSLPPIIITTSLTYLTLPYPPRSSCQPTTSIHRKPSAERKTYHACSLTCCVISAHHAFNAISHSILQLASAREGTI